MTAIVVIALECILAVAVTFYLSIMTFGYMNERRKDSVGIGLLGGVVSLAAVGVLMLLASCFNLAGDVIVTAGVAGYLTGLVVAVGFQTLCWFVFKDMKI